MSVGVSYPVISKSAVLSSVLLACVLGSPAFAAQPFGPPSPTGNLVAPKVTASGFRLYENNELPDSIEVVRDVVYGKGGDVTLRLNIIREKNPSAAPKPVVVYLPGGGWVRSDKEVASGRLAALAQHGYVGVSVQYRTSAQGTFPAQIEDCKCAIRFLRSHAKEYNIDPDRIAVWGSSAGGHLALLLGTTADRKEFEGSGGSPDYSSAVKVVSAWYPPTDLRIGELPKEHPVSILLGGSPATVAARAAQASPITHVSGKSVPAILIYGSEDRLAVSESKNMAAAMRAAGAECEQVLVQGYDHGFITAVEAERMMHFFDKHLKR